MRYEALSYVKHDLNRFSRYYLGMFPRLFCTVYFVMVESDNGMKL
jgi:hypothetical protein